MDHLLSIDGLNGIEWTPDPQVPKGGDPQWYPMYKKILDAGKCVQAVGVSPEQVVPLLDNVGGKGMYIMTWATDEYPLGKLMKAIEQYW